MEGLRDCDTVFSTQYDKFEEPCKLISKDFDIVNLDFIKNRLTFNTGFLVIGVIGKQGVGKSFILNMLANLSGINIKDKPFETTTLNDLLNFSQKTNGIDIHVTLDRVILLDCQPILNLNHLGISMEKEKKIKVYSSDDMESEGKIKMSYSPDILTVQMISYLLSVCHTVLVVDDHIVNYRLMRLIDIAHRLKPWIACNPPHLPLDEPRTAHIHPNLSDEFHDYVAQMVLVENMCHDRDSLSLQQQAEQLDCLHQLLIGYRFRVDEQNALHAWLRELRERHSFRHTSHLKRKLQQQREKLHNNRVVQLEEAKSEDASDDEVESDLIAVQAPSEEEMPVVLTQADWVSDCEDDELIDKRLNRSIYRPIRLVRMPLFTEDDPRFEREVRSFQQQVFRLPRKHFCATQSERFTEQCWLEYATDQWHGIKNSQIFTDYFFSFSNILVGDM